MADGDREFALLCPHCGEENPPEFPVCWSCHGDLPQRARTESSHTRPIPSLSVESAARARRRRIAVELAAVLLLIWMPWVVGGIGGIVEPFPSQSVLRVLGVIVRGLGIIALILYLGSLEGDWRARFGLTRPHLGKEALWTVLVWLGMLLSHTVAVVVASRLGIDLHGGGSRPGYTAESIWLAPLDFLVYGFVEELFYRAYLWDRLTELTRRPDLSIVVSAALFAAAHVYPLFGTLSIFFTGVLLGWIFRARRSLWALGLAHCLLNLWLLTR